MILTINREGEFIVTPTSKKVQCGKIGVRRYRYFVSISANSDGLTKEGYVMENLWCDEYFKMKYEGGPKNIPSCEEMAGKAVKYFLGLFAKNPEVNMVDVTRIYVRIYGSDVSFIEAEWKK